MSNEFTPAPVAGAVEALIAEIRDVQSRTSYTHEASEQSRTLFDRIIAALQPAPAVAVEQVEAWQKLKFVHRVLGNFAHAPLSDRADAYAIVGELIKSTWLAARSAPTMLNGLTEAERVPLTDAKIYAAFQEHRKEWAMPCGPREFSAIARATERAHRIGSGSATEGRANG